MVVGTRWTILEEYFRNCCKNTVVSEWQLCVRKKCHFDARGQRKERYTSDNNLLHKQNMKQWATAAEVQLHLLKESGQGVVC